MNFKQKERCPECEKKGGLLPGEKCAVCNGRGFVITDISTSPSTDPIPIWKLAEAAALKEYGANWDKTIDGLRFYKGFIRGAEEMMGRKREEILLLPGYIPTNFEYWEKKRENTSL